MDANFILTLAIAVNCVLGAGLIASYRRKSTRGWLAVHGLILLSLGVGYLFVPDVIGFWGAGAYVVLVLLPALGASMIWRLLTRGAFARALQLARALALLHPVDGWQRYPDLVRMFHAMHAGDVELARTSIRRLSEVQTPFAQIAMAMGVQLTADWDGFCSWFEHHPDRAQLENDGVAVSTYLAAIARSGRRREMLNAYERIGVPLVRKSTTSVSALVRLSVFVQLGRVADVEELLETALAGVPPSGKRFNLAEAHLIAGNTEEAERLIGEIIEDPAAGATLHVRAERLRESPPSPLEEDGFSLEELGRIDEIEAELEAETAFSLPVGSVVRRPIATWSLAAILFAVFGVELSSGDPTDLDVLTELGALVIPAEEPYGEWWRPLSAALLHFGALHLALNVAGLVILGRWLESVWSRARFVACYVLALVASTTLVEHFVSPAEGESMVFVGASGGVMGLLGALLGRLVVGRLRGGGAVLRRQLGFVLVMVALQVVFDRTVPEVSSEAHAIGMVVGLLFGLLTSALDARASRDRSG